MTGDRCVQKNLLTDTEIWIHIIFTCLVGQTFLLSGGSDSRESACSSTRVQSLGLGRSLGAGNGNPLQYSCLENPMDRRVRGLQLQRVRHD